MRFFALMLVSLFVSSVATAQVGTNSLTPNLYGMYETEQVTCSDATLAELQEPDVYGVTCYFTTLSMQQAKSEIDFDISVGQNVGLITYWDGWENLGSRWRAYVQNNDGTAGDIYLYKQNGGVYVIAYAIE